MSATRVPGQGAYEGGEIGRLDDLARWLDSRYRIPGTNLRFGFDSILGLLPGVGDTAAALPAVYVIMRARQLGVPNSLLAQMIFNVGLDLVLGSVPLVGNVFDFFFKANLKNIDLFKRHLEARQAQYPDRADGPRLR